jgi:hypothetical protein
MLGYCGHISFETLASRALPSSPNPVSQGGRRGARKTLKPLSGLPLSYFWERGTEGERAEMCVHGSPCWERDFEVILAPLSQHGRERG